jgi:uncharacterized protein
VALIYFLEKHPVHYQTVKRLFTSIEANRFPGIIASLVFAELLVPAYRAGEVKQAEQLAHTLSNFPNLEIIPLTAEIACEAARPRARYRIRTPDAIHVATALAGGAGGLVTNDLELARIEPELRIWLLE